MESIWDIIFMVGSTVYNFSKFYKVNYLQKTNLGLAILYDIFLNLSIFTVEPTSDRKSATKIVKFLSSEMHSILIKKILNSNDEISLIVDGASGKYFWLQYYCNHLGTRNVAEAHSKYLIFLFEK